MSEKAKLETLVRRAVRDRSNPLADDILEHLIHMIVARDDGDRYRVALHHQKARELLDRYAKKIKQ
jgi:hypothetical protein